MSFILELACIVIGSVGQFKWNKKSVRGISDLWCFLRKISLSIGAPSQKLLYYMAVAYTGADIVISMEADSWSPWELSSWPQIRLILVATVSSRRPGDVRGILMIPEGKVWQQEACLEIYCVKWPPDEVTILLCEDYSWSSIWMTDWQTDCWYLLARMMNNDPTKFGNRLMMGQIINKCWICDIICQLLSRWTWNVCISSIFQILPMRLPCIGIPSGTKWTW